MNLLNFFNTFDGLPDNVDNCTNGVGGAATDCRGADTQAEFDRQWPKTVAAILAMDADVVGVNEIENDGYGPDSAIAVPGRQAQRGDGARHLRLHRRRRRHRPGQRARHRRDQGRDDLQAGRRDAGRPDGRAEHGRLRQRRRLRAAQPPVARAGVPGERHRRACSSSTSTTSRARAAPAMPRMPATARATATRCASTRPTSLLAWLATDPTGTGDPDVLMLGDYNSYAMEDPITRSRAPASPT